MIAKVLLAFAVLYGASVVIADFEFGDFEFGDFDFEFPEFEFGDGFDLDLDDGIGRFLLGGLFNPFGGFGGFGGFGRRRRR